VPPRARRRAGDPGETPLAAAVRETVEEVGFDPLAAGRLLGPLDALLSGHSTVPVAAYAAHITAAVEPVTSDELAAAWWAPTRSFQERLVEVREVPYRVPALVSQGADGREAVVWGMTYRLLDDVRSLVD